MATVLIVDDENAICKAFQTIVERAGHACLMASTGSEGITLAAQHQPDAVFLDVRLPDMDGLAVLNELKTEHPELPVVVMTAHGTINTAIQAVRQGAFDYLGKPLELEQIRTLLARALETRPSIPAESSQPAQTQLIGRSAVMQELFKMIGLLADNNLTVLISGETGVGKEMVARAIHQHSARHSAPFVAVNCAAIPETLIESELFGHTRGAFSGADSERSGRFESAATGTLFLDEVFELPLHLQSKLLRVLQERQFEKLGSDTPQPLEARIIAASNRSTEGLGEVIREDLYHRLSLINLHVPALRERPEDILLLARHFLAQANAELSKQLSDFTADASHSLQHHSWPGNVRELEHTVKRSALTARGQMVSAADLVFGQEVFPTPTAAHLESVSQQALRSLLDAGGADDSAFHELVTRVERALIEEALRITEGNQVAAAQLLGINRTTLRNKAPTD